MYSGKHHLLFTVCNKYKYRPLKIIKVSSCINCYLPSAVEINLSTGHVTGVAPGVQWVVPVVHSTSTGCNKQGVAKLTFDPSLRTKVQIDMVHSSSVTGFTFNIGDSPTNNGYGETWTQSVWKLPLLLLRWRRENVANCYRVFISFATNLYFHLRYHSIYDYYYFSYTSPPTNSLLSLLHYLLLLPILMPWYHHFIIYFYYFLHCH